MENLSLQDRLRWGGGEAVDELLEQELLGQSAKYKYEKWNTKKKQIWNQNTNMEHLVQGACLQGGEVARLVRRVGDHVDGGEEGQQERRRKCSQDWWKLTC